MGTERPAPRIPRQVYILFPLAVAAYLLLSGYRLLNYGQPAYDLGIYDQSLWLIWNGESFNTVIGLHVFGAHFSPILYVLAPLAALPGGAFPELTFQAILIAAGVWPAVLLGRSIDKPWLFGIIYIAHPGIVSGVMWGFRPWNLAPPLLMLLAYLLVRRCATWRIMSVVFVLFLLREDMGLWVLVLLGISVLSGYRSWRACLVPGLLSIIWGFVALGLVIPRFAPDGDYVFDRALAVSPTVGGWGIAVTLVCIRIVYLALPFGALALWDNARRSVPLIVPLVGLMLLGGNARFVLFHYEMLFIPVLLMLLAMGDTRRLALKPVLIGITVTLLVLGPLRVWPLFGQESPLMASEEHASLRSTSDWLSTHVTDEDGLTLASNLIPHFSERRQVAVFPYPLDTVTYPPYPMVCSTPSFVVEPLEREIPYVTPVWDAIRGEFTEVHRNDHFVVYEADDKRPGACRSSGG